MPWQHFTGRNNRTIDFLIQSTSTSLMRTDYCGAINTRHLDKTITLCGWVHRRRDHGGVIFIDLRDREGLSRSFVILIMLPPSRLQKNPQRVRARNHRHSTPPPGRNGQSRNSQWRNRGAGQRHRNSESFAHSSFPDG